MERIGKKRQVALLLLIRNSKLTNLPDQDVPKLQGVDAFVLAFNDRIRDRLHDEARRDPRETFPFDIALELLDGDLLDLALVNHVLSVVKLHLGQDVYLVGLLEAGAHGKHRDETDRPGGNVRLKVAFFDIFLINPYLLVELHAVGNLNLDDSIEKRLVRELGLKLVPLGKVRVRHDHAVKVDQVLLSGCGDDFFLRGRDDRVQILDLVLKNLDELDQATIAHVERAVEAKNPWVILRVLVYLGDVHAPDQNRGVLVVRVDGRDGRDPDTVALGERDKPDGKTLVLRIVLVH